MKRYALTTLGGEHTLPVEINGNRRYITFKKPYREAKFALFETSDNRLQAAIESTDKYIDGIIQSKTMNRTSVGTESTEPRNIRTLNSVDPAEYSDVTSYKEAKEILAGEPYNIAKTSPAINTPEKILAKANELGISFPNLKAE